MVKNHFVPLSFWVSISNLSSYTKIKVKVYEQVVYTMKNLGVNHEKLR